MSLPRRLLLHIASAILLSVLLQAPAAFAHMRKGNELPPVDAILIPSLSHGQMAIIGDYRPAILSLGETVKYRDTTASRLMSYIHLQRAACLWGLVPQSIADEASPFNECSHAYLAATRTLLLHLADFPETAAAGGPLRDAVETAMMQDGTSLSLCRYSDLPFNTGEILAPHWQDLPNHLPSLLTLAGTGLALIALTPILFRRKRYPPAERAHAGLSPGSV